VLRRWKSGEIDYTGSISKCGDRRVRTLFYEAANVMLTRYRGGLALKSWALRMEQARLLRDAHVPLRPALVTVTATADTARSGHFIRQATLRRTAVLSSPSRF
jgi:transposase